MSILRFAAVGWKTHQTVALDIVRRPKATHELEGCGPACGGCGLDRACCPATVSHHGIDDNVRLMQETTAIQPSQRPLTQNIWHSQTDA